MEQQALESEKLLSDSVLSPCILSYQPPKKHQRSIQHRHICKLAIAIISILMVSILTACTATGNFFFVPGLGAHLSGQSPITHSIEHPFSIEVNGFTIRILGGFIDGNRVNVELLGYETKKGPTVALQPNFMPYSIYFKGKKCTNYQNGAGNSVTLSYELPHFKKKETVIVALHGNDIFLTNISLIPVKTSTELNKSRPQATVNDITLFTDVIREENEATIYLSAILPKGTPKLRTFSDYFLLYVELEKIYIRDENGNIYGSKYDDWDNEGRRLLRSWRIYTIPIPADIKDFTIVIPEITYVAGTRGNMERVPRTGPWEIQYTSPQ